MVVRYTVGRQDIRQRHDASDLPDVRATYNRDGVHSRRAHPFERERDRMVGMNMWKPCVGTQDIPKTLRGGRFLAFDFPQSNHAVQPVVRCNRPGIPPQSVQAGFGAGQIGL